MLIDARAPISSGHGLGYRDITTRSIMTLLNGNYNIATMDIIILLQWMLHY